MKIVIASDHAGFPLKEDVRAYLATKGHEVVDLGVHSTAPSDYPHSADAVGDAINSRVAQRAELIRSAGVGVCLAANKIPGIRAGMCHDHSSAHQGVEHDDMNVLVLGARVIGTEPAHDVADAFLAANFVSPEPRFVRRFNKVLAIEAKYSRPAS